MQAKDLKEVKKRKATKPRKKQPRYCSVKMRLNEREYDFLKMLSCEINKPMAEIVRSAVFDNCKLLHVYADKK